MTKQLLSLLTLFLFYITASSQSCLPEGITFSSQDDIDNFHYNYPNCTEIEGNVFIGGYLNNISDLEGLSELQSIGGDLKIESAFALIDLEGLNNLEDVGGSLSISYNAYLVDISALNNLSMIGNHLNITGNASLITCCGLENIKHVPGFLAIQDNPTIAYLTGLNKIERVDGDLLVSGNDVLASLTGLFSLDTIGGDFTLEGCPGLTSLKGMEDLTRIDGDLNIVYNDYLLELKGLNNLSSIGGSLNFKGNTSLRDLTALINLTAIAGDIRIGDLFGSSSGNMSLTNLCGLNNIDPATIEGLYILNNPSLSNCEVQSICSFLDEGEGIVQIMNNGIGCDDELQIETSCDVVHCLPEGITFTSQQTIDQFQGDHPNCAEIIGDVVIEGPGIDNLSGLSLLTGFWRTLTITGTHVQNLDGLSGVQSIGEDFIIENNPYLNDLSGMDAFVALEGGLHIEGNPMLESLEGLDNLAAVSVDFLNIYENMSLTTCHMKSICDMLDIPGFPSDIHDNGMGCNDGDEVDEMCDILYHAGDVMTPFVSVRPNPVTNGICRVSLDHRVVQLNTYAAPMQVELQVVNVHGQVIQAKQLAAGQHESTLDLNGHPSGLFLVRLLVNGSPAGSIKIMNQR